eukprot:scaffold539_cov359-Prasinococcus_capsulatus_cf.AAC.7
MHDASTAADGSSSAATAEDRSACASRGAAQRPRAAPGAGRSLPRARRSGRREDRSLASRGPVAACLRVASCDQAGARSAAHHPPPSLHPWQATMSSAAAGAAGGVATGAGPGAGAQAAAAASPLAVRPSHCIQACCWRRGRFARLPACGCHVPFADAKTGACWRRAGGSGGMGGLIVQRGLYEAPDEMEREWEQCFVKLVTGPATSPTTSAPPNELRLPDAGAPWRWGRACARAAAVRGRAARGGARGAGAAAARAEQQLARAQRRGHQGAALRHAHGARAPQRRNAAAASRSAAGAVASAVASAPDAALARTRGCSRRACRMRARRPSSCCERQLLLDARPSLIVVVVVVVVAAAAAAAVAFRRARPAFARDGFQLCCWLLNKAVMKWSRLAEGIHMQIVLLARCGHLRCGCCDSLHHGGAVCRATCHKHPSQTYLAAGPAVCNAATVAITTGCASRELLKAHATDVEGIYLLLLRHVPVGEAGLPLAAALLDALQENMQWLQGRQLLPVACYAFLRLLASHVRVRHTSPTGGGGAVANCRHLRRGVWSDSVGGAAGGSAVRRARRTTRWCERR